MICCNEGSTDVARLLLQNGADTKLKNSAGKNKATFLCDFANLRHRWQHFEDWLHFKSHCSCVRRFSSQLISYLQVGRLTTLPSWRTMTIVGI